MEPRHINPHTRYSPEEQKQYYDNFKAYRDIHNAVTTARREGLQEGWQEGRHDGLQEGMEKGLKQGIEQGLQQGLEQGLQQKAIEIARNLKALHLPTAHIAAATGLPPQDIENL